MIKPYHWSFKVLVCPIGYNLGKYKGRTYEVLDILNFCCIIDVFRCGTVSGVGIASPVGKTPAGFGLAVGFCFAI